MTIILRFVDKNGFIKGCFFHVVHVRDTIALTLKKKIYVVLSRYNLWKKKTLSLFLQLMKMKWLHLHLRPMVRLQSLTIDDFKVYIVVTRFVN